MHKKKMHSLTTTGFPAVLESYFPPPPSEGFSTAAGSVHSDLTHFGDTVSESALAEFLESMLDSPESF